MEVTPEKVKAQPVRWYGWKNLSTEKICQMAAIAHSKDELFESSGFGAVRVNEPIKGCLAVEVENVEGRWLEKR